MVILSQEEPGVFKIRDKFNRRPEYIYENVDDLCEVSNLRWLEEDVIDDENATNMASDLDNSRRRYIRSLVHDVYDAQLEVAKWEMPTEKMTKEYREVLQSVYITKTKTLELLHVQHDHLFYHRIERLLQLSVISGPKLDKQLLKQLIRQKCNVCKRAKDTDSKHTGRVPDNTLERFSMNLSARFEMSAIHSNYHQMAIIDVKSKYV
jgi:hypothetical protein